MSFTLYVIGTIFLTILAVALCSDEENWEVVKKGQVVFAVLKGVGVVTIERHKFTKEVRAFLIEGNNKESINIDYARELIGHESSWLA